MEKGLLFLTLAMLCLWVILDDFFGDRKLSNVAKQLAGSVKENGLEWVNEDQAEKAKEEKEKEIEDDPSLNPSEKKWLQDFWDKFWSRPGGEIV